MPPHSKYGQGPHSEIRTRIILNSTTKESKVTSKKKSTSKERLDYKTVVFGRFRKAGSAVSVILERERLSPFSLAVFTLAPDLSFEYGLSLAFAKNRTVLQSKERPKSTWPADMLTCSSHVFSRLSYGTSLLAVTGPYTN